MLFRSKDIKENFHKLEIVEMDSSNIPRSLDDFDFAVIPRSRVYNAGIDASTVLLQEKYPTTSTFTSCCKKR